MKRILLSISFLAALPMWAQDLAVKIPKDATVVASANGDKLLELMSAIEFDNSFLGTKLLEEMPRYKKSGVKGSIADYGLKLDGTAYFFSKLTDTISYNCVLMPLVDAGKFEQVFKERDRKKIIRNGDLRQISEEDGEVLLQWNNEMALLVIGDLKTSFLERDSVMSERYGLKDVNYSDYYYERPEPPAPAYIDGGVGIVEPPPVEDYPTVVEAPSTISDEDYPYRVDTAAAAPAVADPVYEDDAVPTVDIVAAPVYEDDNVAVVAVPATEEIKSADYIDVPPPPQVYTTETTDIAPSIETYNDSYYNNSAYENAYREQRAIKDSLTRTWVAYYATTTFNKKDSRNSILEQPAYQQSKDPEAVASLYLSSIQDIYLGLFPYLSYRYLGMANAMAGYGSMNANLYMDEEEMRIATDLQVDDDKAASFRKMYRHKPNKKFARYIDSEKMVGFIGYSFDTEQYLKELPQLIGNSYGSYLGLYRDEMNIGAELFSLLLDEKAIAKVVKGDAVFLLNDIGPKEYTYTSYEYDDDYERKEVKKKKTETLPDFLFMMSSDDTHLVERVLNYGIRKEQVVLKNGVYSLSGSFMKNSPFGFHILIKDGIIFCGTSFRDIQQISEDNFHGNMSKEHKKLLLKNNMSMLFNPKNIVGKISSREWGSARTLNDFNTLMANMGPMYARTTGIKNNCISGEMIAKTTGRNENALKYFFSMIELAAKLD